MASRNDPLAPSAIEVQLQAEKASALRRVGHTLERLLEDLRKVGASLPALAGEARRRQLSEYARLRAEAERQRWYLIVQREAMGLTQHADVYQHYPLPPALH